MRTGFCDSGEKTSRIPPRTEYSPTISTGSRRWYPMLSRWETTSSSGSSSPARRRRGSWRELRAMAIIGQEQVEETGDGFGEVFGLFVAIYYNDQRTPGGLPEEDGVHRLRGGRQAG